MMGNNYLDEDDDYFRKKLSLEEFSDNVIEKFLKSVSEKEEVPSITITPKPGFCVKTYTPEGDKVFINICYTDAIPDPDDITEEELDVILKSDATTYRIPMSIGELHVEADRSGNLSSAYDVAVSENFFNRVVTSQFFKSFFLVVVLESLEDKYSMGKLSFSPDRPYNILKFRKCIGTLGPHRIQQRPVNKTPVGPPKPLIEEIGDGDTNKLKAVITSKKSTKPLIEEISEGASTSEIEKPLEMSNDKKTNRKRDQRCNDNAISEKLRKQNEEFDDMLETLMNVKEKNVKSVSNIPIKEVVNENNGKKNDLFTGCNKNLLKSKFFNCIADKENDKVVQKEPEISTAITIKQDSLDDDDQSLEDDSDPPPKKTVIEEMDKIIENYLKDNKLETSVVFDDESDGKSSTDSEIIPPDLNSFEISTRYSRIDPEAGLDEKTQLLVNKDDLYKIYAFPNREEPDLLFIFAKYKSLSGSEIILDLKEDQAKISSEQQDEIIIINVPINIIVSKATAQFYVNSQDLKIIAPVQVSQSND